MAASKKENMENAVRYMEEIGLMKLDFKCGMFPKFKNKEFHWMMTKMLMFLDKAMLNQMRRDGKTMDDVFKECEKLTGDTNFMYLVSLYNSEDRLKVYTVHALNARRLEGEEVYSRIDDAEPWW